MHMLNVGSLMPSKGLLKCRKHLNVKHRCGLGLASSPDKTSPQCRNNFSPLPRRCLVEIYPVRWTILLNERFLYGKELSTSTSCIPCMTKLRRISAPGDLLLQSYASFASLRRQQVLLGWAAPLPFRQRRLHRRFTCGYRSTSPSEEMSPASNRSWCSLTFRVIIQLVKLHRQCMPAAKRS